jgi:hypothetical protein
MRDVDTVGGVGIGRGRADDADCISSHTARVLAKVQYSRSAVTKCINNFPATGARNVL